MAKNAIGLDKLMKGYSKLELILRNFNGMDSPVPCSSDVRISPNNQSIIEKTKKPGKRSNTPLKMVWEFMQFEILNRLFNEYSFKNEVKLFVPAPIAVYPQQYKLLTSFCPGFILHCFSQVERGAKAIHFGKEMPIELSVTYFLGALTKLKELEGIYHSDFDLRHIIFDPIRSIMGIFDLENARYITDKEVLHQESRNIVNAWFHAAQKRGMKSADLFMQYEAGRKKIERSGQGYISIVRKIEQEYGIELSVTKGEIDRQDAGLRTVKNPSVF